MFRRPAPSAREAAREIAWRELDEADVDLALWRRALARAPDEATARERYVSLRAAVLVRELPQGAAPLLIADADDRKAATAALAEARAAWRATPEGQQHVRFQLGEALRGLGWYSLLYYGLIAAVVAWVAWGLGAC